MQDRPSAPELLKTIADLLEGEVLEAARGPLQHQVRVAGNLCRILERELALAPAAAAREGALLRELLGPAEGRSELVELNEALVSRLLGGSDPAFERKVWRALVEITKDKLAVAKPGHDDFDFRAELEP